MRKEKEKDLNLTVSSKPVKLVSATLFCLMLISAIIGSGVVVVPTKATPAFPWEPLKIWVTKTAEPFWGYYGGYHDIWAAIKPELAKIGIDLDTSFTTDDFTWWERVWDVGWNKTHEQGGWDVTMLEWWLQPHSLVPWFESMVYGNMSPPLGGFNIYHWNNTNADKVLRRGMRESDALKKKSDLWLWQEIFMHDPPWADVYNPRVYEMVASYLTGYNPSGTWWYDISQLRINSTKFYNVVVSSDRRAAGPTTCIYAVSEDVWAMLPMYMETYTEEQMRTVLWNTLYKWGIKPEKWPSYVLGEEVDPRDWACVPDLALKDPIMLDGGTRARVILRDNVYWSDGVKLTATDVQFTFNTCTLNLGAHNSGYGDFISQLKDVKYVNETCVDFILQYPVPMQDLKSCLSNDWGGGVIMPFHNLSQYMAHPGGMRTSTFNTAFGDPSKWLPVTGPFKMTYCDPGDHITFVKNPDYFGYDLGWGPYDIDTLIFKWIPDAATRLIAMQNNEVDFGEYPTGSVSTFKEWQNSTRHPNVRVFQYDYPASNAIWFNLDHPILSNRYVRMAIAHAIPYEKIFDNILPSWGIETAYRGLTHILPCHYYTDPVSGQQVSLYNEPLAPYEYNITKAIKYMEMWWYSKDGQDKMKGPRGDADFSGRVELDDFYIWVKWFGKTTAEIKFLPGQDKDPNWDNTGYVDMYDFYEFPKAWGFFYPENSTTHLWSR